jgi:hypothetical protein
MYITKGSFTHKSDFSIILQVYKTNNKYIFSKIK